MTYCKLGDRAIVTHSMQGNEGRLVEIVKDLGTPVEDFIWGGAIWKRCLLTDGKLFGVVTLDRRNFNGPIYMMDGTRQKTNWGVLPDAWLRPLPQLPEENLELEEQT